MIEWPPTPRFAILSFSEAHDMIFYHHLPAEIS
jgi:hypothetical protein